MTTTSPDDFAFPLGDSTDDGMMPITNQSNPFNLSDLSSSLPPSLLMSDNTNNEVSGLYIEILNILLLRVNALRISF